MVIRSDLYVSVMNDSQDVVTEPDTTRTPFLRPLLILLVLIGIALRFTGSVGELWLDEIWSLSLLTEISNPLQLITELHRDNNHILNSLWMWLLGADAGAFSLRLLSLFCSVISLLVVLELIKGRPALQQLLVLLFFSFSYVMILYGSEARGYSGLVMCCLIAYWKMREILLSGETQGRIVTFWAAVILGPLFHLSFLQVYFALFLWSLFILERPGNTAHSAYLVLRLHVLPLVLLALLGLVHIQHIPAGSGPLKGYLDVIIDTLAVSFGGRELSADRPGEGLFNFLLAVVVLGCALYEIYLRAREKDNSWVFYLLVVLVFPCCILAVMQPRVVFLRYFLVNIVFLYLLLAGFFSRSASSNLGEKILCTAFVLIFLIGHGNNLVQFVQFGRGQPVQMLEEILANTTEVITYGRDHPFRIDTVFEYHIARLGRQGALKPVELNDDTAAEDRPDWCIEHTVSSTDHWDEEKSSCRRLGYEYLRSYPHVALSGWTGRLFKRNS